MVCNPCAADPNCPNCAACAAICEPADPCAGVRCAAGEECFDGQCLGLPSGIAMTYRMTQCADPWDEHCDQVDLPREACIAGWLEAEWGVTVSDVRIDRDPAYGGACEACSCDSGRILTVVTDEPGASILLDHGFTGFEAMGS